MRRITIGTLGTSLLVLALALPATAEAQVSTDGSTKISLSGGGFIGPDFANMSNIIGVSRFLSSGLELGGDLMMTLSRSGGGMDGESEMNASGYLFGRLAYNFVGESMTVPFVSMGVGTPLESESSSGLVNLGAGFKRFINERVSFDVMANMQGQSYTDPYTDETSFEWSDGLSLFYGLSIYLGN